MQPNSPMTPERIAELRRESDSPFSVKRELLAEVERLRAALELIMQESEECDGDPECNCVWSIASDALKGGKP